MPLHVPGRGPCLPLPPWLKPTTDYSYSYLVTGMHRDVPGAYPYRIPLRAPSSSRSGHARRRPKRSKCGASSDACCPGSSQHLLRQPATRRRPDHLAAITNHPANNTLSQPTTPTQWIGGALRTVALRRATQFNLATSSRRIRMAASPRTSTCRWRIPNDSAPRWTASGHPVTILP